MKMRHIIPLVLVAFAGLSLGSGCPTVPKIEDRVVELAVGGSTIQTLPTAVGSTNVLDATGTEDLVTDVDIQKVLSDAGIDPTKIKDIKLQGISYRVTVPDPNPNRTITGVTVKAGLGAGPGPGPANSLLITSFTQNVDAASSWTPATVDPAGVALINQCLAQIVALARDGTPVTTPTITYHVQGTSTPTGQTTNFTWQIKLELSVVGSIKVKVLS